MAEEEIPSVGRHRRLADDDDSDAENAGKSSMLTSAKAADLCPKEYRLIARNGGFTELDDLSALKQLDYVDVTGNQLRSLDGLRGNRRLKTLIARSNRLADVSAILKHDTIRVLNVAENVLPSLDWLRYAAFARDLVTLISTGNRVASLDGVLSISQVRTLVISHNVIDDLNPLAKLTMLEKLSASHNEIRSIPPSFEALEQLRELRVSHNKITALPSATTLRRMTGLRILDIGHNRIESFESIGALSCVLNVSLRDNPACSALDDVAKFVRAACASIEVVDNVRVAGGRRKVRINRLRVAAGMDVESDRKYARAPPMQAVKKLMARDDDGAALDKDTRDEGLRLLERAAAADPKRKRDVDRESSATGEEYQGLRKRKSVDAVPAEEEGLRKRKRVDAVPAEEEGRRKRKSVDAGPAEEEGLRKRKRVDAVPAEEEGVDGRNEEEDDEEIKADEFMEQARANSVSKAIGGAKVKAVSKGKKRNKRDGKSPAQAVPAQPFGCGGDSKW